MFRYALVFFLLLSMESTAKPLIQDEVTDALSHAEALYYEARFKESMELLSRIDSLLQPEAGRVQEKARVKLQLALAHLGLNETAEAKAFLRELFTLDADFRLDSQEFSSKVLAMSEAAKAEANKVRCQKAYSDGQRNLEARNAAAVLNLIQSIKSNCAEMEWSGRNRGDDWRRRSGRRFFGHPKNYCGRCFRKRKSRLRR